MIDIVERLRARKIPDTDCIEAANEIERLRALVDETKHAETYGRRSGGAKEVLFR